jgi:hypothetical protein
LVWFAQGREPLIATVIRRQYFNVPGVRVASGKQYVAAALGACAAISAFFRGYFLLGLGAGVAFGLLAACPAYLVGRVFVAPGRFRVSHALLAQLLGLSVLVFLANPSSLNSDFAYFIEGHQSERATQSEVATILGSDARFAALTFKCRWRKCVVLEIEGSVKSDKDLLDVRSRIFERCPHVSSRWLFWNVLCEDSGVARNGCDLKVFRDHSPQGELHRDNQSLDQTANRIQRWGEPMVRR